MQTFNLSASQLKMRIVNFQGDKKLISLFFYIMVKMTNKEIKELQGANMDIDLVSENVDWNQIFR